MPDRFRPNINSSPISTFQRVCLRPKLEGCLSLSGTPQAWNAGGLVITGQNIHDLWTFKGALWLLPGVGCVMHIQTHKHTVPAPGFVPPCVYLQCACNLCCCWSVCVYTHIRIISSVFAQNGKKSHPCQYGTSPACLVVNCWGLVFGKQPNKPTLPVGQSKSATQHSLGGSKQGRDISRWQRGYMHTHKTPFSHRICHIAGFINMLLSIVSINSNSVTSGERTFSTLHSSLI